MSQEHKKSSMSPEERALRRASVGKAASEKVAKSEQLNFRLEEQSINELQSMAFKKGVPVGTMIREWVLERLSQEKFGTSELTGKALLMLDEIHGKLNCLFDNLAEKNLEPSPPLRQAEGPSCDQSEPAFSLPFEQGEPTCYLLAVPAPAGAPRPLSAPSMPVSGLVCGPPSAAPSNLHDHASQLDHLKAWEHLLGDQLNSIRHQREEVERSQGQ